MGDARGMLTDLPHCLVLSGASNLRDLGGWPVADGRRVRAGSVWRSAALHGLTPEDLGLLAATGLRTVCDLRGAQEAARAPSRLPAGALAHPLPIEPFVGASLKDMLERGMATGEGATGLLRQAYLAYVTEHLEAYRRLFALLLEEERRPLLFHCSAGKDRTGVAAALILTTTRCRPRCRRPPPRRSSPPTPPCSRRRSTPSSTASAASRPWPSAASASMPVPSRGCATPCWNRHPP